MMFSYQNHKISNVAIVDDKSLARQAMSDIVVDADLNPYLVEERITSKKELFSLFPSKIQALIFDHHLNFGNYANFYGAEGVSDCFKLRIPALLVTKFYPSDVDHIRTFRKNIPVIYNSDLFDSENIYEGLRICIDEQNNQYSFQRKPHRNLFRIVELDEKNKNAFIIIPSWNPGELVRIPYEIFGTYQSKLVEEARFFANINIGAENHEDLYFADIELAQNPTGEYANFIRS